jgi:hypothetical protein
MLDLDQYLAALERPALRLDRIIYQATHLLSLEQALAYEQRLREAAPEAFGEIVADLALALGMPAEIGPKIRALPPPAVREVARYFFACLTEGPESRPVASAKPIPPSGTS